MWGENDPMMLQDIIMFWSYGPNIYNSHASKVPQGRDWGLRDSPGGSEHRHGSRLTWGRGRGIRACGRDP
jgi:hypothetical protein